MPGKQHINILVAAYVGYVREVVHDEVCEHIKGSRRQQWPSKSRPGQEQPQNL